MSVFVSEERIDPESPAWDEQGHRVDVAERRDERVKAEQALEKLRRWFEQEEASS